MPYFLCGSNHDKKVESTNRAECDVLEQPIDETYIKEIQISENIITYVRGDDSTGTAEIEKASEHLTVPTCDTLSFTYTGSSQGPTIIGLNKDVMTVTGTESAVEVGDYTISIVPKAGYIWDDNTLKEPKVFNWKINYALIGETPTQKGTLTYTGTSQTPSWNNFDSNKLSMSGSTSAIVDGTYTVTFTPKSGYAWSGTDTAARTATWTINPVLVSTIPSQSGTLTYNAADQSPTWNNYDSSQLTLAGVTSSTNAGTYTATFTPKTGHAWSDGSKTTKSVNWSIGKAAGSLSVDKTTVVLNSDNTTVNVIPTVTGDGAVSVVSNNTEVATVSYTDGVIAISSVNDTTGDAVITVSVAEGSNYLAPANVTITVSAQFISSVLDENSWDDIAMVAAQGEGTNYWSVGDVKYITVNGQIGDKLTLNNETFGVFILGFDHNASEEGTGISFGTFKTTDGIDVCLSDNGTEYEYLTDGSKIFNMNHWGAYNYGGWKASDIRYDVLGSTNVAPSSYGSAKASGVVGYDATDTCATSPIANTLMAALPSDLRAVMKPITKYTDNVAGNTNVDSNNSASVDYLPMLSEFEVQGSRSYANSTEQNYQKRYQYYINGNSKVKYTHTHSSTGIARYWWVRSLYYAYTNGFCYVSTDGSADYDLAGYGHGLSCAFLVGYDLNKLNKPTISGNSLFISDGTEKSVSVFGFSPTLMTMSGTTSATAAGDYTITISLKDASYKWADGTSDPVTLQWKIDTVSSTLDDNSWDTIAMVAGLGQAANVWNVGDVKYINVNGQIGANLTLTDQTFGVFILGFDHNADKEGRGISFGTFKTTGGKDVCLSDNGASYTNSTDGTKMFNMNHWGNYNCGGWKASDIRYDVLGSTNVAPSSYGSAKSSGVVGYDATDTCATSPIANTLMAALPADLRAVMKPITKYTDNVAGGTDVDSNNSASVDYLPMLSEYEVQGTRTYANSYEQNYQKRYQYYINGNSKIKYTHSSTKSACDWWVRSPHYENTYRFCYVGTDGGANNFSAYSGRGVACAFLVGIDLDKLKKPTVNGSAVIIADGNNHTLSLNNFDDRFMSISGTTSATAGGEYSVTISLKSSLYKWADGTADPVVIPWKIVEVSSTLNDNSWEDIATVATVGTASNYWNVGDVKYINVNGQIGDKLTLTDQTYGVFILGFDHNSEREGTGISFGTFKTTDGIDVCLSDNETSYEYLTDGSKIFNMNHWGNYNYGGWKASDIRYDVLGSTNVAPSSYGSAKSSGVVGYDATATCATSPVSNTLMAALPSDLRAVMKPITKYTDNVAGNTDVDSNNSASIDYLPLLSEYEVQGARTYANSYEQNYQKRYQYYTNGNSKVKYTHSSTGTARYWWVRSPYCASMGSFCYVSAGGGANYTTANGGNGISCAFLVGYDLTKINKPTISGPSTFISDGTAHSISLSGFNPHLMTISGRTTATADGEYTVTISLNNPAYKWADGTTDPVTLKWKIVIVSTTLNDNSWDVISTVSATGEASNYWNVGDVKYINVNGQIGAKLTLTNQTFGVFILGFDHNSEREGSGISFGTFKTTDGIDVCLSDNGTSYEYKTDGTKIFNINHWGNYNYGGWKASDIRYDVLGSTNVAPSGYGSARSTTNNIGYDATATCATSPVSNTLMAALPSDLRAVMKPITKYTDNVAGDTNVDSNNSASIDYLPFLSEYEVHGTRTFANQYEQNYQKRYQYYTNGNSKVKYTHSSTGNARFWWVRSPSCAHTGTFCSVNTDGSATTNDIHYGLGLSCAFLV